ncbi:RHS repeat domain-containing protein [Akkermansia muciniphila]|uniref:RHS repeat domain-containing protein n=1 Tax=Akkermansia muciniphila TaxID=239935 RepID=UPI001C377830|nr:RHS repeat-associated core domain-containing protein [Akkermansia muciniphila]MBV4202009.1 RHS repeat-associated core domain-containing protein [Akkermansia muciniphila]MCQ5041897.1 RHS repeat-associated core domain-containing protein [Akkermansia muciniphila]
MLEATAYTTGPLNQYTAIERGEEAAFEPVYDADGNQTLIRTSTGIWQVSYNAENLPVRFVNESAKTVVECTYDYMGRRHTRKVSVNGTVSNYLRYMYRGYLQIAAIDAVSGAFRWFLFWDPTQPEATRPLAIRKDGTWYAYGWDLTRNVTEVFGKAGYLRTAYTYTPYGEAAAEGDVTQPIQWSSEYNDEELGLVYYNYRHLNPHDGRWISRDPIMEQGGWNLYAFVENLPVWVIDHCGLEVKEESRPFAMRPNPDSNLGYTVIKDASFMDKDLEIEYDYKKEKNKCRVFVKNIKEPILVILEYWPSEDEKIVGYSKKGVLAIIGHEKRRLQVYQKADETYIKLVINNVKILYAEDESREKAEKKLNNYIQKYYDSAKDCLLRYAREQQKLITPEANEWNLIREKLNNEVIGIKWTHKVPDPKPAPMPMLPEGLGRTGN